MNKKNLISGIGGVVIVILVIVLVVSGIMKKVQAKKNAEVKYAFQAASLPVTVERVKAARQPQTRGYPGTAAASEGAELSFRVGGPLVKVDVLLGAPVQAGTLLMQIDPRDFEDRIAALEAQLAGAQAILANAQQDFGRAKQLFGEKVIAQSDYDRATSSQDSAAASVKNLKAQLQIARHSLEDTELRAPYDGQVTEQLAENHEMVTAGATVLKFHDIHMLEVTVNVPENEIIRRNMESGSVARVSFPAAPDKKYAATLKEWSSAADSLTRTYAVTFRFPAPRDIKVLPGMSAEIAWADESSAEPQLTVPVSALVSNADGGSLVWIYNERSKTAERRVVQIGPLSGASRVVVVTGLEEGDPVVVSGSRLIHESQAVVAAFVE